MNVRAHMCMGMRTGICMDMCIVMCMDMFMDMCMPTSASRCHMRIGQTRECGQRAVRMGRQDKLVMAY